MNRKMILIVWSLLLGLTGCGKPRQEAIRIGPVSLSALEFQQAFEDSRYIEDGGQGRQPFLDHYIDTRLLLLEAERLGLDKDPDFLRDIQRFWEMALLRRVIAAQNQRFLQTVAVSRNEIQDYYDRHSDQDFSGRPLDEVQDQIQWILRAIKQNQMFVEWLQGLRQQQEINIDESRLGIKD